MTIHTIGHIWCDDEDCAVLDKLATENKRLRAALERIATKKSKDTTAAWCAYHAREALEEVK